MVFYAVFIVLFGHPFALPLVPLRSADPNLNTTKIPTRSEIKLKTVSRSELIQSKVGFIPRPGMVRCRNIR